MKTVIPPREYYAQALACVEHAVRTGDKARWETQVYAALRAAPPSLRRLTAAILTHARWAAGQGWGISWETCAGCIGQKLLGYWDCGLRPTSPESACPVYNKKLGCVDRALTHTLADIRREARAAGLRW